MASRGRTRRLPLTIDLDSTICETYGMAKEGARHHGYTGARGYHPLLATAAGTGDVLMARLREGRANTARGAAHFLRETVGRVRCGGASGQLTVRADSGFYAHTVVSACREVDVRFSITIRQHASLRDLIEAIPEEDWTPIPYWMDGAAMSPRLFTELVSEVFSRANVVIKTASNYGRLLVGNIILSSLASIIRMSLWSWTSETNSTLPSRPSRTPRRCGSLSGG